MEMGSFGGIVFRTGGTLEAPDILTPQNIKTTAGAQWAYHEPMAGKPWSEYLRPKLRTASFQIGLNILFGQKPREAIEALEKLAEEGTPDYFVIGGRPLSENQWKLKSLSVTWGTVYNGGELADAECKLELEEYL